MPFCQFRHVWLLLDVILGKEDRDAQQQGDDFIASAEAFGVTCAVIASLFDLTALSTVNRRVRPRL